MSYLIALGVFGATAGAIWLGCHFGGKWVDRMLCFRPEDLDPNKPIVLPPREPCPHGITTWRSCCVCNPY